MPSRPTRHAVVTFADDLARVLPSALRRLVVGSLVAGLVGTLGLGAAGCDGCSSDLNDSSGFLTLDVEEVDFGLVVVGQQAERRVRVRNRGRGALDVGSIAGADGFPATFLFSPQRLELAPEAEAELVVVFSPVEVGSQAGSLTLANDGSNPRVSLPVKGIGFRPDLRIEPAAIDFGPVVVGEITERSATVTNQGDHPVDVTVDAPTGDAADQFRGAFLGDHPQTVHLEPGAAASVLVAFQPAVVADLAAPLGLRACATCTPVVLPLTGRGVAAGLVPEPALLDFGPVLPGTTARRLLTFRNIGGLPIAMLSARPATQSEFTVEAVTSWPTVLPDGTCELAVLYRPTTVGPDAGQLVIGTDDPRAPTFTVDLKGYGGGPAADVSPTRVDFGVTGLAYPVSRRVVVRNAGPADATTDIDNLVVTAARLEVGGVTAPVDFEFVLSLNDGAALPAVIEPGGRAILNVRYSPLEPGDDAAELVLETNDQAHPVIRVPLTGKGAAVYPCDYALVPAASPGLQFGLVGRGRASRLTFQLRNAGPTDCIVARVELAADASPAFTLPNGPVFGRMLAPGASLAVPVEFAPPETTPAAGADFSGLVEVELTSELAPRQNVEVSGRSAETCITISPPDAVFGTVPPLCATNERTFTVYNACRTTVDISAIDQRLGRDAFRVLTPALPARLAPGAELRFTARYAPQYEGDHFGTIEVFTATGPASTQPYVLSLEGSSATDANMAEEFVQAERAKADILFVVDDSGSMEEEQATLSREFSSFMRFAIAQGIDYRLAVTTTGAGGGCGSSDAQGRFLPLNGANRIVTPGSSNPEAAFRANVNVGTNGCAEEAGLEAAYLALSEPNLSGPNSGFLRADAVLSVIVVSDEEDYSDRPVDFYVNYLKSLKGSRGANLVTFGAIVGNRSGGCTGGGGSADFGARYVDAATKLNGLTESICNASWSNGLQALGLAAFGYRSRFLLSSDAQPSSVQVFVDDQPIAANTLWTYSPDANAVDFDPTAVPPAGSRVRVTYAVACR